LSANQKAREFEVEIFGSANVRKFEVTLRRGPDGPRWERALLGPKRIVFTVYKEREGGGTNVPSPETVSDSSRST